MKIFSRFCIIFAIFFTAACSSVPKDEILARADGLSSRPDWVTETDAFVIQNGTVYMSGTATLNANGRLESGYRIAENNAKAGLAGAIEQKLNFIFQNAEEGTDSDAAQARFIGAESSELVTSSMRPDKRYWEKVAVVTDPQTEKRDVVYRIFVRVSMPESDFKKAVETALKRGEKKKGLSADFAKKVDAHWDAFTAEKED